MIDRFLQLRSLGLLAAVLTAGIAAGCGGASKNVATPVASETKTPPPVVMPPPQKMMVGAETAAFLSAPRIVTSPEPGAIEQYACEVLWRDFRRLFGVAPFFVQGTDAVRPGDIVIGTLRTNPALTAAGGVELRRAVARLGSPAESYVVHATGAPDKPVLLVAGGDASGVLYGVQTLLQVLRLRENRLEAPWPLTIEDWPALPLRGVMALPDDSEGLDLLARWRINAVVCTQFEDLPKGPGATNLPAGFKRARDACHRRGIQVFGAVSQRAIESWARRLEGPLAGLRLRLDDKRAEALVERLLNQFAKAGANGLFLMLDTPPGEGLSAAALGREHGRWARIARRVAAANGMNRLRVAPAQARLDYDPDYYRAFRAAAEAPDASGAELRTLFCPFREDAVRGAVEAGLTGYEWWHNGVWPLGAGEWSPPGYEDLLGGFYRVEWGWYGAMEANEQLLQALRTTTARTSAAWGNVRGLDGMWGSYCWNPRRYAPESYEVSLAEVNLGPGAGELYWRIVSHLRRWAQNAHDRVGAADRFMRSDGRAREALEQLAHLVDPAQPHPGLMASAARRGEVWELRNDADRLRRAALRPVFNSTADIFVDQCRVRIESAAPGAEVRYTLNGSAPTAKSPRARPTVRLNRSATILANTFVDGQPLLDEPISAAFRQVTPQPPVTLNQPRIGLWREYYEGSWTDLPHFENLEPDVREPSGDLSLIGARRDERIGFVFHGFFKATHTGVFRFRAEADHACRFWIAGKPLFETGFSPSGEPAPAENAAALAEGYHLLRIEYCNPRGKKHLSIEYRDDEMPGFAPIPPALLAREGQAP